MTVKNRVRIPRFKPDPGTLAFLDKSAVKAEDFRPVIPALILNESTRGCALLLVSETEYVAGERGWVQVGPLAPVAGEIRWVKKLDSQIFTIGFMFVE